VLIHRAVRNVLVYCRDVVCNHGVTLNVDHLPDDTADIREVAMTSTTAPGVMWWTAPAPGIEVP
jgi:hypothetical protein